MQMISGTIKSAVQLDVLLGKWEDKKENNDWCKDTSLTMEQRTVKRFQEDLENVQKNKKMQEISSKVMSGQRLSSEELDYLQKNNPQLYSDYKEIQGEREAYERKLKNCKTKEEVDRLKTNQMNQYAATAKKTFNNPNIPLSEKYRIACKILGKIAGISEEEAEFKCSAQYKDLESETDIRRREHAKVQAEEEIAKELGEKEDEGVETESAEIQNTEIQNTEIGNTETGNTETGITPEPLPVDTESTVTLIADLWNAQRPIGEGAQLIDAQRIINDIKQKDNEV